MRHQLALLAGLMLLGVSGPMPTAQPAAPIAVIVHPENPVDNLSLEELRRLYLGRSTTFRDGTRVELLELAALRKAFYQAALGMAEDRVRRHWVTIAFQGELATPPREVPSATELRHQVADRRGAIGFLAFTDVDSTVKVLLIDGIAPGQTGYPLH